MCNNAGATTRATNFRLDANAMTFVHTTGGHLSIDHDLILFLKKTRLLTANAVVK